MMNRYILVDKKAIPEDNFLKWALWLETSDRSDTIVKKSTITKGRSFWKIEFEVSTVFLGLDHNFFKGEPLIFETMIFSSYHDHPLNDFMERYSTWNEAEIDHANIVKAVNKKWFHFPSFLKMLWKTI